MRRVRFARFLEVKKLSFPPPSSVSSSNSPDSPSDMALRRPPTAVSLKPSDVSDLQAALEKRNQAQAGGHSTEARTAAAAAEDELLRREQGEQDARERKGQRERVMGA
ncbi:hypothetical protein RHOSPDRAFT_36420 [Rhodotorula sp. JG-1b]|nr:hypothetical protein RHOSPDRAFT_36420 [Rhodotorula sp. JG-1b]